MTSNSVTQERQQGKRAQIQRPTALYDSQIIPCARLHCSEVGSDVTWEGTLTPQRESMIKRDHL